MNTGALNAFAVGASSGGGGDVLVYATDSVGVTDTSAASNQIKTQATDALIAYDVAYRAFTLSLLDQFSTTDSSARQRFAVTRATSTFLVPDQAEIDGTVGRIVDVLTISTVYTPTLIYTLSDRLLISSAMRGPTDSVVRAISAFTTQDALVLAAVASALSTLVVEDEADLVLQKLAYALSVLAAQDSALARHELLARAAAAVLVSEAPSSVAEAEVLELLTASDSNAALLTYLLSLADTLLTIDECNAGKTVLMKASDVASLQSVARGLYQTTAAARSSLDLIFELVILGQAYDAWAVNTESAAASMYTNYSYDSMFCVNGRAFGVNGDGLYRLDGDTDAGEPIFARIVTGELDFGTTSLKRVEQAWIAYASDGDMVLKVIVRNAHKREEHWYRSVSAGTGRTEAKLAVGRGIESHYWQFELVNAGGADFELDNLQFRALALSRRV